MDSSVQANICIYGDWFALPGNGIQKDTIIQIVFYSSETSKL